MLLHESTCVSVPSLSWWLLRAEPAVQCWRSGENSWYIGVNIAHSTRWTQQETGKLSRQTLLSATNNTDRIMEEQEITGGPSCRKRHRCDRWLAGRAGGLFSVQNQVTRPATIVLTCFPPPCADGDSHTMSCHTDRSATPCPAGLDMCTPGRQSRYSTTSALRDPI